MRHCCISLLIVLCSQFPKTLAGTYTPIEGNGGLCGRGFKYHLQATQGTDLAVGGSNTPLLFKQAIPDVNRCIYGSEMCWDRQGLIDDFILIKPTINLETEDNSTERGQVGYSGGPTFGNREGGNVYCDLKGKCNLEAEPFSGDYAFPLSSSDLGFSFGLSERTSVTSRSRNVTVTAKGTVTFGDLRMKDRSLSEYGFAAYYKVFDRDTGKTRIQRFGQECLPNPEPDECPEIFSSQDATSKKPFKEYTLAESTFKLILLNEGFRSKPYNDLPNKILKSQCTVGIGEKIHEYPCYTVASSYNAFWKPIKEEDIERYQKLLNYPAVQREIKLSNNPLSFEKAKQDVIAFYENHLDPLVRTINTPVLRIQWDGIISGAYNAPAFIGFRYNSAKALRKGDLRDFMSHFWTKIEDDPSAGSSCPFEFEKFGGRSVIGVIEQNKCRRSRERAYVGRVCDKDIEAYSKAYAP